MKVRIHTLAFLAIIFICQQSFAQPGLDVNQGSSNNTSHSGGMAWIGNPSNQYLSLDNNEIQARNGSNASTLYLNYYGGRLDLLGSSNTTGDLAVDGSGLYYDNSTNKTGFGTSAPAGKISINHTSSGAAPHIRLFETGSVNGFCRVNFQTTGTSPYWTLAVSSRTSDPEYNIYHTTAGNVVSVSALNGGRVGISTTSPVEKLHVIGNILASGNLRLGSVERFIDAGTSTIRTNSDFDSENHLTRDLGGGTTGNAWDDVFADNYVNVSDMREKSEVNPSTYGLNEILAINPISYKLAQDPQQSIKIGLSAQELLTVIPEAVKATDMKFDEEGNMTIVELERYGVTYNTLIPVLITAIQELNAKVQALKSE